MLLLIISCKDEHRPPRESAPQAPSLVIEDLDYFDEKYNKYNDILNLRQDCFQTKSPGGLLGQKLFVGSIANNTVGFFAYRLYDNNKLAYIHDVCIGAPYRQKGIGRKLFNQGISLIEAIPSLTTIELKVYTDNFAAIKLYQSAGFFIIDESFDNGKKIYRMRKNIKNAV